MSVLLNTDRDHWNEYNWNATFRLTHQCLLEARFDFQTRASVLRVLIMSGFPRVSGGQITRKFGFIFPSKGNVPVILISMTGTDRDRPRLTVTDRDWPWPTETIWEGKFWSVSLITPGNFVLTLYFFSINGSCQASKIVRLQNFNFCVRVCSYRKPFKSITVKTVSCRNLLSSEHFNYTSYAQQRSALPKQVFKSDKSYRILKEN